MTLSHTADADRTVPALPAAVLWDMDGTLVDTEPYWIEAEHELVAAHGGVWNDEFAHQLVGNALEVSAQLIIDQSGIALSVPEIIDALLERVITQVEQRVPWRPGARELLLELGDARGARRCSSRCRGARSPTWSCGACPRAPSTTSSRATR